MDNRWRIFNSLSAFSRFEGIGKLLDREESFFLILVDSLLGRDAIQQTEIILLDCFSRHMSRNWQAGQFLFKIKEGGSGVSSATHSSNGSRNGMSVLEPFSSFTRCDFPSSPTI